MADDWSQQDSTDTPSDSGSGMTFDQIKYLIEKTQAVPQPKPPKQQAAPQQPQQQQQSPFQPAQQRPPQQQQQPMPQQRPPMAANVPQQGKVLDQASGAYIRPDTAASLGKFRQQGDQLNQQDAAQQAANPQQDRAKMVMKWAADMHRLNPTMSSDEILGMAEKIKSLGGFGEDPSKALENKLKESEIAKNEKYTEMMGTGGGKGGGFIGQEYARLKDMGYNDDEIMKRLQDFKRTTVSEVGAKEDAKNTSDIKAAAPKSAAEEVGKARGTAEVDYAKVRAGMPGLKNSIGIMANIGSTANYTVAQDILATTRRQLNLPVGQGALDAAQYEAVMNNILIPKLRSMFGARVTNFDVTAAAKMMGNPQLSPAEKAVQLQTYIDQAMEVEETDYQTVKNLGGDAPPPDDVAPSKSSAPTKKWSFVNDKLVPQ